MSGENEDLVRRANDAWSGNDWESLEPMFAPGASIRGPASWPESGTFHRWPEIRGQFERLNEPWSNERAGVVSIESHGNRVLSQVRWRGHGGESGLELDLDLWNVYRLEGGLISEVLLNLDEESARADLGSP